MATEYDRIPEIEHECDVFTTHRIEVGVIGNDGVLQMIAIVNNDGTTIRAKRAPYLMIPYHEGGKLKFARKKEVVIPARRFLERTVTRHESRWRSETMRFFAHIADEDHITGSAMGELNKLGKLITEQMKNEITRFKVPHNAPLTIANKGKDDPLIDTGALRDAIDYRIVSAI